MKDSDWEILRELYGTKNITKVANRLYMTQPALTKRLQLMEEEFQIKIADRSTKGVVFTAEGELLAQKAVQHVEFMKQIRQELRVLKAKEKEVIVIGSSYTYSKYVLTELLYSYTKEHPGVRFEVINEQSNILFRKACDGEVDVAFIRGDYAGNVNQRKIDELYGYLLTNEVIPYEELPESPFIDYKMSDKSRELFDNWWRETYHTELPAGMSAGYVDVAWQLVSKGLGYTLCFLPENYHNEYNLEIEPLRDSLGERVTRSSWFVYKDKDFGRELQSFINYIEQNIVID